MAGFPTVYQVKGTWTYAQYSKLVLKNTKNTEADVVEISKN